MMDDDELHAQDQGQKQQELPASCCGWLSKISRASSRALKRFYWIDARKSQLLCADVSVAVEVTLGQAPLPQGVSVKTIKLFKSIVSAGDSGSIQFAIKSSGKVRVFQAENAGDKQRWCQHLRALAARAAAAADAERGALDAEILRMREGGGLKREFDEKVKRLREEGVESVKGFYVADMHSMVELDDRCSLYSGEARKTFFISLICARPLMHTLHSLHCLIGDVYVFIKFKSSLSGPVPHVFVWKGAHSTSIPLLAWARSIRCNCRTLLRSVFDSSFRTLKAATQAKHGRFGTYQIMAQGCETPEFVALFPAYFVVYEGRLASMFSPSAGTLKHQRARQKSLGSNIFLVLHP